MSKWYRLKKDLPDSKAGDVYSIIGHPHGESCYYKNADPEESYWAKQYVENNPEWFEEIKESEKLKVINVGYDHDNKNVWWYVFGTDKQIEGDILEKYSAIKQAIEQVLNDDINVMEHFYKCQSDNWEKEYKKLSEQLNKMMEDAFNAARDNYWDSIKYKTFQDYLSSIKK